jgi:hypothetical protein
MKTPPDINEVIAAFDDDALLKTMLAQIVETFPSFADAPERVRETRDRLMKWVAAAPAMREALLDVSTDIVMDSRVNPEVFRRSADAGLYRITKASADAVKAALDKAGIEDDIAKNGGSR